MVFYQYAYLVYELFRRFYSFCQFIWLNIICAVIITFFTHGL